MEVYYFLLLREPIQCAKGPEHRRDWELPRPSPEERSRNCGFWRNRDFSDKSLEVLQVTRIKKTMIEETDDKNKESVIMSGQKCLLSTSDEGSEGLERFLSD